MLPYVLYFRGQYPLKIMPSFMLYIKKCKLVDAVAISMVAVIYTLAWNWSSPGPAYLYDTVGYMVNAAILAGYQIDAMGSWHAGYSLLLAPIFLMDDPFLIWKVVQILNALLVGIAVFLSGALIDQLRPSLDRFSRAVILLIIVVYPAFSAIAGYAYSSPVSSVNVLLIALFLSWQSEWNVRQGVFLGIIAGFSYWIHPTGVVVIAAALIALLVRTWPIRWITGVVYLLTSLTMIWIYRYGIYETLYSIVTPSEFIRFDHYKSLSFGDLMTKDVIFRFFGLSMGQLSYQLASTFGLVWIGAWSLFAIITRSIKKGMVYTDQNVKIISTSAFAVLLIVGIVFTVAVVQAGAVRGRTDYWIYGRYTDAVLHPLLTVGLLAVVARGRIIKGTIWIWGIAVVFLMMTGWLLYSVVDTQLPHSYQSTLAFWPQYILSDKNFFLWMLLAALGVFLMGLIVQLPKLSALIGAFITFLASSYVSGFHNLQDRRNIEETYSHPSSIVDIVRSSWPRGSCVGFVHPLPDSLTLMQRERYRLYAYYLFNYNYRRYTLESWKSDCLGPMLTYDAVPILDDQDLKIILREESTGLYLVGRDNDQIVIDDAVGDKLNGVELVSKNLSAQCLVKGCFTMNAPSLSRYSQVGSFDGSLLKSDGRAGFLFFGPYRALMAGNYEVWFDCDVFRVQDAYFDVVSSRGAKLHARVPVLESQSGPSKAGIKIQLSDAVQDVEIRLHVENEDQIACSGYRLQVIE